MSFWSTRITQEPFPDTDLIQQILGGASDSAFLTGSQVMPVLLACEVLEDPEVSNSEIQWVSNV